LRDRETRPYHAGERRADRAGATERKQPEETKTDCRTRGLHPMPGPHPPAARRIGRHALRAHAASGFRSPISSLPEGPTGNSCNQSLTLGAGG
jgi:hypothetical protein